MLTLARCTIYFLLVVTVFLLLQDGAAELRTNQQINYINVPRIPQNVRYRRAIRKPGFFWTIGSSIFQQYNETKSAIQQIRNLINDQFIDERRASKNRLTTSTTAAPDVTTTTEQYRISRNEFNKIVMRNLRGLVRLYNLELADALKQSHRTRADFNQQLRISIKDNLS